MTRIMGVVNVTPDSFSDGGLYLDAGRAIGHATMLVREGADLLDIGGESTRPGAHAVDAAEEAQRVVPVLEGLVGVGVPVSIDTTKASVAAAAIETGATIVNDISALRFDPDLLPLCAEKGVEVVLMHMQGTPRTMQEDPVYDDVVEDVKRFLAERIDAAIDGGIAESRIWVDPGIGFGKTIRHNLELLWRLGELSTLGRPIVVGTSRKSFLGRLTEREVDDRLGGTIASNVLAAEHGADVLRVHDVKPLRDALTVSAAVLARRRWGTDERITAGVNPL